MFSKLLFKNYRPFKKNLTFKAIWEYNAKIARDLDEFLEDHCDDADSVHGMFRLTKLEEEREIETSRLTCREELVIAIGFIRYFTNKYFNTQLKTTVLIKVPDGLEDVMKNFRAEPKFGPFELTKITSNLYSVNVDDLSLEKISFHLGMLLFDTGLTEEMRKVIYASSIDPELLNILALYIHSMHALPLSIHYFGGYRNRDLNFLKYEPGLSAVLWLMEGGKERETMEVEGYTSNFGFITSYRKFLKSNKEFEEFHAQVVKNCLKIKEEYFSKVQELATTISGGKRADFRIFMSG